MEAISKMNIDQSAKKVKLVLDEVRNTKVNDALVKLSFANKKSAKYIHQTISSALAILQQTDANFDADELFIKKAFIAATLAESFLNQKPIKKYEQRPTPSHPKKSCKKLSEVTNISIAKVNKDKYAINLVL